MIISVSRRCDIPRFKFDWFMEQLDTGFFEVANPYNASQIRRISLLKDDVDVFAFWTRDPRNILANADELTKRGFPYYVMVTVTGYPAVLEPDMIPAQDVLLSMKKLAQKIGTERVIWRYDPVIFTSDTDGEFHRRNFSSIAENLSGSVTRVIISVYDDYPRAAKRLNELEKKGKLRILNTNGDDLKELLAVFSKSAEAAGMEIQSCAEKEDYSLVGIKPGACIDAALIAKLCGRETDGKDKNQRPNCLCCKSADIGVYRTCPAKCVYCYAY